MKVLKYYASIAILTLAACSPSGDVTYETNHTKTIRNGMEVRSSTIKDPNGSLFVESTGVIKFNRDQTEIASLSPNGYLIYKHNGTSLFAENNDGIMETAVVVNGSESLDPGTKQMIIKAAHEALVRTDSLRNVVSKK